MNTDDRTEKPTRKHRERARKRGQVARSADVGGSVVLAAGLFAISVLGPMIVGAVAAAFRAIFAQVAVPGRVSSAGGLDGLMHTSLSTIALGAGPIAGACLAGGVLAGAAQVGFRPRLGALTFDVKRINPFSGAKRLFGPNAVFEALKAVAKIAVVGIVAAMAILPGMTSLAAEVGIPPGALALILGHKALAVAQRATFAYLAIGVIDYAWQRRRHERDLRMSKQQVKDELRQHELPAEVEAARRRRRMQLARKRMMAAVPEADVVVTNPTHFAVALSYDGSRTAPVLVAKGQDLLAAQIRRIAEEHDVPIVADPPLARALHSSAEVGQMIPEELYAAVARVLAFVYRVARRRRYAR
ncbi:MAG TPA: EscU/YscU/HrcU family type III secretion system export apparatus switch protein [Solirubrobacteraceae bacterium]